MEFIFAYGTLNDPAVQLEIWGRETDGEPDILADFALSELETADGRYPLVVPRAGSEVPGWLLAVTPAELASADEYETVAYRRHKKYLKSGRTAWIYLNI